MYPAYQANALPNTQHHDLAQVDGERLPLPAKDLGSCDLYPQTLSHNPNGRFVTVCGDGEYIIYTALAWRNKSFGTAEEFVWGEDSSVYATRCEAAPGMLADGPQREHSVPVMKRFSALARCLCSILTLLFSKLGQAGILCPQD